MPLPRAITRSSAGRPRRAMSSWLLSGCCLLLVAVTALVHTSLRRDAMGLDDATLNNVLNRLTASAATAISTTTTTTTTTTSANDDPQPQYHHPQPDQPYDPSPYPDFWRPLNCHELLSSFEGTERDLNHGILLARKTITETAPSFWVSIHNKSIDVVRWDVFTHGLYYERQLTKIFERILAASPAHARVVDVGGNIGWFTLLSASMGHHVDTFEPLEINRARLCQSIVLNQPHWQRNRQQHPSMLHLPPLTTTEDEIRARGDSATTTNINAQNKHATIHLRPYGISDAAGSFEIGYQGQNPGNAKILTATQARQQQFISKTSTINLTTLDTMAHELGWLPPSDDDTKNGDNNPNQIAILKIDIEGNEPRTVAGAQQLLQSGIVHNVLLEVTAQLNPGKAEDFHPNNHHQIMPMLKFLCQTLKLHQFGWFRGPSNALPDDMPSSDNPDGQAEYVVQNWVKPRSMKQVNLWFVKRDKGE